MVNCMAFDTTLTEPLVHPFVPRTSQMMMSPLCTKAGAYVLVMAASTPFFFQLYATAVRLLNDAVNVGRVFAQITVAAAEMVTAGARYGLTVTVTGLETEDEQPN